MALAGKTRTRTAYGLAALVLAAVAAFFGLRLALRPLLLHALSSALGARVTAEGPVTLRAGTGGPVLGLEGVRVRTSPGAPDLATLRRAEIALPWSALFAVREVREARLQGLRITLQRDAAGHANWPAPRREGSGQAPRIDHIFVQDGAIRVQDGLQQQSFQGAVATDGSATPELVVQGAGASSGGPWRLRLASPAKLASGADRPLDARLELDGSDGRSTAAFRGRLSAAGDLVGSVEAAGPDLHEFARVLHLSLPHTPRYSLSTELRRPVRQPGREVVLDSLAGRVGASDVQGRITIDPQPNGRRLGGELHTRSLRMSDLLDVASGGELTRQPPRAGRLLPDGRINLAPLRQLYGALRFDARSVQSGQIRSLAMTVHFDGGRVSVDPLRLGLGGGRAEGRFTLDGRRAVPAIGLGLRLEGVTAAQLLASRSLPFNAALHVETELQGSGSSLYAAAAHSSGRLRITLGSGHVGALQAAALTADLAQGLSGLFHHSQQTVALRCARADFAVQDGLARAEMLRLVTDAGAASGTGALDFRTESMDLLLRPLPPAPQLTAVRLQGPLTHPHAELTATGGARQVIGTALHVLAHGSAKAAGGDRAPAEDGCAG